MRAVALSATKAGMTRLLDKGGASKDALYLLENGYINASQRPTQRPGTVHEHALPPGTKGLCAYRGGFVVFSHQVTTMTDPRFSCSVLSNPEDGTQPIKEIHLAEPFLGVLYVVAEFDNGDVVHYWLQGGEAWQAEHAYRIGDVVQPTVPNGLVYRLESGTGAYPEWEANVARATGDTVVPTEDNGFYYEVTNTIGDSPKSGTTEPDWPTEDGATVYEDVDLGEPDNDSGGSGSTGSASTVPRYIEDRYSNRASLGREVQK